MTLVHVAAVKNIKNVTVQIYNRENIRLGGEYAKFIF